MDDNIHNQTEDEPDWSRDFALATRRMLAHILFLLHRTDIKQSRPSKAMLQRPLRTPRRSNLPLSPTTLKLRPPMIPLRSSQISQPNFVSRYGSWLYQDPASRRSNSGKKRRSTSNVSAKMCCSPWPSWMFARSQYASFVRIIATQRLFCLTFVHRIWIPL